MINVEEFRIHTKDKKILEALKYSCEKKAKACLIIAHGMAEHQLRYEPFARFMCENNFVVYTYDMRGHGKSAGSLDKVGFFADKEGYIRVVKDLRLLIRIARKEYPELPRILMGHSMGTFVCGNLVYQNSELIDGLILSGTTCDTKILSTAGIIISYIVTFFMGKSYPSRLMTRLSFGKFNNEFKPNRTKFDWLTRDEKEVDKYVEDPYCGSIFSSSFYRDMLRMIKLASKPKNINLIRKDLPIYLMSGAKDPVSNSGQGVKKMRDLYKKAGIKSVEMKLYPEGRHEMLNEINRDEVFRDILKVAKTFISKHS